MLYAKKANVQVEINKKEKDLFLSKGYSIYEDTDGKGKGFKLLVTPDGDYKTQIKHLKSEIVKLNKQLANK